MSSPPSAVCHCHWEDAIERILRACVLFASREHVEYADTNLDVCIGGGLDGKAEEAIATSDVDLNLESAPTLTGLALTLAGTLLTHN